MINLLGNLLGYIMIVFNKRFWKWLFSLMKKVFSFILDTEGVIDLIGVLAVFATLGISFYYLYNFDKDATDKNISIQQEEIKKLQEILTEQEEINKYSIELMKKEISDIRIQSLKNETKEKLIIEKFERLKRMLK